MKTARLLLALGVLAFGPSAANASPVNITNDNNVANLLASLLGSTAGLSGITGSLSGNALASGTFTGGPFGFASGVVLSTGDVVTSEGPNNSSSAGLDLGAGGAGGDTTELTINFTSDASVANLFFQYVFGSEEFYEYIGSAFNDNFTLSLDSTNFAKLACGSNVAINNFVGACATELLDNAGGVETQLDAYTKVLLFTAPITPGAHSLVLHIADVGDGNYDSAVFINGGTVGTQLPTDAVPEPASLLLVGSGMIGAAVKRYRQRRG